MSIKYIENPSNFHLIEPYVITQKQRIAEEIIHAKKCCFYDACSFQIHAASQSADYMISWLKRNQGLVVLTRCILMELVSDKGKLADDYISYIEAIHKEGIKILVIYEEDLQEVFSLCFSKHSVINEYFAWAVKTVKCPAGTITKTLKMNRELRRDILETEENADKDLMQRFFREVRKNKETGDNLGEELLVVCVHMLANIPEAEEYKYIIITDDKGAVGLVNKAAKNIRLHKQVKAFTALTTTKLSQKLYEETIIQDKQQVKDVLAIANTGGKVRLLCSEEYDLEPKERVLSVDDLAEKIVTEQEIYIYY